ncbi:hypothetical protein SSCG_01723 [Streptomyces clavuligerus]|nr:hypothetical protein SSCG_01723 [Streptomyces clavuligerus]
MTVSWGVGEHEYVLGGGFLDLGSGRRSTPRQ